MVTIASRPTAMSYRGAANRGRPSNLKIAIMIGNLNPTSTTRPCTQCSGPVPKSQVLLLTCDKCREKKKKQKARRKERDIAIEEGRGEQGFSSAPLLAVVAKQDAETAARMAARRKDGVASAGNAGAHGMAFVYQAILDEHQRDLASKKKTPARKVGALNAENGKRCANELQPVSDMVVGKDSSCSTAVVGKRKLKEVDTGGSSAATAKKRTRSESTAQVASHPILCRAPDGSSRRPRLHRNPLPSPTTMSPVRSLNREKCRRASLGGSKRPRNPTRNRRKQL
jgi:hypothetical protein